MRSVLPLNWFVSLASFLASCPRLGCVLAAYTSAAILTPAFQAGRSFSKLRTSCCTPFGPTPIRRAEIYGSSTYLKVIENSDAYGDSVDVEEVDVAIIGAGIGGLCAGAILNTLYEKKVGIYESHYLAGGCAHAFERSAKIGDNTISFTFDSGPTIVLGCSKEPYNPLQQVLRAVGVDDNVEWIPYDGWGMIEHPSDPDRERRWKLKVGPEHFENGPLREFGSNPTALEEFNMLREITKPLVTGAATIPAMAMRPGSTSLVPLLRYLPSLFNIISNGVDTSTGPFGPFLNGPIFKVTDKWLRDWLDALAFSLSGLPAERTSAAAMAYVLFDMHREGAALDYPKGGLGEVVKALVKGVEQKSKGNNVELGSKVHLRRRVESIEFNAEGNRAIGLNVRGSGGRKILVRAKEGVICNVPIWSVRKLVKNKNALRLLSGGVVVPTSKDSQPNQSWTSKGADPSTGRGSVIRPRPEHSAVDANNLLDKCDTAEMTGSFLHLHVALDAKGLDLDKLQPHYTVMDRGLEGDGAVMNGVADGPCGELNMIAVSNPCVLDRSLAPEGYIVVHAYGAGNEPFDIWTSPTTKSTATEDTAIEQRISGERYQSSTYEALKNARAVPLWRAIESIIPDARDRTVLALIGSPLTHARFLRRPYGTYGAAIEDCLKDGSTPIPNLVLAGDGVFPGIGIPAVALSGASAANGMVGVVNQWMCMDDLKLRGAIN
mmetsp:Transcript_13481/g.29179  ORF Transcript_13481/g.29179 Transcript_13481/m.29179 type:complete len:717 (+) Transcript_13481:114-2264(+)